MEENQTNVPELHNSIKLSIKQAFSPVNKLLAKNDKPIDFAGIENQLLQNFAGIQKDFDSYLELIKDFPSEYRTTKLLEVFEIVAELNMWTGPGYYTELNINDVANVAVPLNKKLSKLLKSEIVINQSKWKANNNSVNKIKDLYSEYLLYLIKIILPAFSAASKSNVPAVLKPEVKIEKIKWMGNVEQFGHIFGELVAKGYIELPSKGGEGTFSKLAALCLQYFEISSSKAKGGDVNKPTTIGNLERALRPTSNNLNDKGKRSLTLPFAKDLS